ncbi:hypothetical protein EB796_008606 [Bugula neritina]|uniref:Methyltransferase type 11 domain-containing protein n=1 Tax=Bugula neritina TaxID=10212 RepID=A0A7J7K394_BUGNE|nr:hypothetical protein EB796_008606 [Bugula neritina]
MHPFRVSPGESLPVEDNSVTLVQAATALHWFDHEQFYRECDRVLVPGGVIAAFNYKLDIEVIKHPNSNELHRIFSEIPYESRKRLDGQYMEVSSTISDSLRCLMTAAFVKHYVNSCEENKKWWQDCHTRLMEAYGTDDPGAPLIYQLEVFMLLGQKPK